MRFLSGFKIRHRFWAAVLLAVVALEAVLCFFGPLALKVRPSLVVWAKDIPGDSSRELGWRVAGLIERRLARFNRFAVKPAAFFRQALDGQAASAGGAESEIAHRVAADMGLERLAKVSAYYYNDRLTVSITISDLKTGKDLRRFFRAYQSFDVFSSQMTSADSSLDFDQRLGNEARGFSLFGYLFFALLVAETLLAVLWFRRPRMVLFGEATLSFALTMALFSFIYALNADMEYAQRFIAHTGRLSLAANTQRAFGVAALRFVPLLLINLAFYFCRPPFSVERPAENRLLAALTAWPWLATLTGAALLVLAFPSALSASGFAFLAWFALALFFAVLYRCRWSYGFLYIIFFGATGNLLLNYWHGTYSYVSLPITVLIFSVEHALLAAPLLLTIKKFERGRWFLAPFVWVVFEWIKSLGFLGYPWGLIGASQYSFLPLIQIASLTGVWGVSLIVALGNGFLAEILFLEKKRTIDWKTCLGRRPAQIFGLLFAASLIFGFIRLAFSSSAGGDKINITTVQQNTDPRQARFSETWQALAAASRAAVGRFKPDLIAWPEGVIPFDLIAAREQNLDLAVDQDIGRLIDELDAYLVFGGRTSGQGWMVNDQGEDEYGKLNYNSAIFYDLKGDPLQTYAKIKLVPFTEYFPYKKELPLIAGLLNDFNASNWSAGRERVIFEHPKIKFCAPVCFEDLFPDHIRRFVVKGAELILVLSNDYWAMTPTEGRQHGVMAIFRAVENRRPLLRATVSGLTLHVDSYGRFVQEPPPLYKTAHFNAVVEKPKPGLTLYSRWGDWLPKALLIFLVGLWTGKAVALLFKRQKNQEVPPF